VDGRVAFSVGAVYKRQSLNDMRVVGRRGMILVVGWVLFGCAVRDSCYEFVVLVVKVRRAV
jgi:hypothetical protein